jgi:hypothetical protein
MRVRRRGKAVNTLAAAFKLWLRMLKASLVALVMRFSRLGTRSEGWAGLTADGRAGRGHASISKTPRHGTMGCFGSAPGSSSFC